MVTGLVPRFTGGRLDGDVLLDGGQLVRRPPRERAHVVGYVGQDPPAGFVTDTVEEELAYGMEQLGLPADTMRRRVEETLDLLGIADLRGARPAHALAAGSSSGSRSARCSPCTRGVLVLDEPTSALDPTAAEDVLATLTRLVHDLGVSVLLAEHRLERVVPFADRMVPADRRRPGRASGTPADAARRLAGRAADRRARPRGRLAPAAAAPSATPAGGRAACGPAGRQAAAPRRRRRRRPRRRCDAARGHRRPHGATRGRCATSTSTLGARPGHRADGAQRLRQVLAAVGAAGQRRAGAPGDGAASAARDPARASTPPRAATLVGLVPQTAADLLYLETVGRGVRRRRRAASRPGHCRRCSTGWCPGIPDEHATRATSPRASGWRSRWRSCWPPRPPVLLLDEPTRGLDYAAKRELAGDAAPAWPPRATRCWSPPTTWSSSRRRPTRSSCWPRARSSPSGPVRRVVAESPAFAPQVTKVLGAPWLRVDEVVAATGERRDARRGPRRPAAAAVRRASSAVRLAGRADDARAGRCWCGCPSDARVDPPFLFLALLPVVIAVVLAEVSEGGMDPRVLAILGVLTAVNAVLRGLSAGTGRRRAGLLPADPGRPGLRARASASCSAAPRCSPRR